MMMMMMMTIQVCFYSVNVMFYYTFSKSDQCTGIYALAIRIV